MVNTTIFKILFVVHFSLFILHSSLFIVYLSLFTIEIGAKVQKKFLCRGEEGRFFEVFFY